MLCSAVRAVLECDISVLYTLRHLLLSTAGNDGVLTADRTDCVQRVTNLLAQSAATSTAATATATATATAKPSLLRRSSAWCLPSAATSSSAVAFSGSNHIAAAHAVLWLAQHTADRQVGFRLAVHSTTLDASSSSGWQEVAGSATHANDSLLATRLQQMNGSSGLSVVCA